MSASSAYGASDYQAAVVTAATATAVVVATTIMDSQEVAQTDNEVEPCSRLVVLVEFHYKV